MRRQATLMPHECVQWSPSDITIDTRIALSATLLRDVMQFRITRVAGATALPESATCVLDAWRGKENVQQRVELGMMHSLDSPTGWIELPRLPADAKFRETKFRLKAVSSSFRVIATCERLTASTAEEAGTKGLFAIEIVPAQEMHGAFYDISPDWSGSLPMLVRVSDSMPRIERRLVENDPELSLGILSMLVPQVLLHMYPRSDDDGDDEFYLAWTGFMTEHGVDDTCLDTMANPDTDPAERGRLARHATSVLVQSFAQRFGVE